MNLTSQQKDLLFAIVDAHLSGDGAPFIFVQSHTGSGLCYPRGHSIPVRAVEVDFRQLAEERLITFVRVSGPGLSGKPTQLGIETAASLRGQAATSGGRPEGDIDAVMKEGSTKTPGSARYPKRAAWFEHELALREWSIHDLQGQGGPDWKTSRKILDGLSVSRSVLEKTAAALCKKKKQVLFRDVPQE